MSDRKFPFPLNLLVLVTVLVSGLLLVACDSSDEDPTDDDDLDGDNVQTCETDLDCTTGTCDVATGTCVEDPYACFQDADCPDGLYCNTSVGRCQDTPSCPEGQILVGESCVSVECTQDADCADQNKVCDVISGTCIAPSCTPPCSPLEECRPGNVCVQVLNCATTEDCAGNKYCDLSVDGGTCVDVVCEQDLDCHGEYYCNVSNQTCVLPCRSDADCEGILICNQETERCEDPTVTCEEDYDCATVLATWICNEGVCEEGTACRSGEDCSSDRKCGESGTCVFGGCFTQEDCTSPLTCDTGLHQCLEVYQDGAFCIIEDPDINPCLSTSRCITDAEGLDKCRPLCEPLNPQCAEETDICAFFLEPGMSQYQGACMPPAGGLGVGSACELETSQCEMNLICQNGLCRAICDPDGPSSQCGEYSSGCYALEDYGVGVCGDPPCDTTTNSGNNCPDGKGCVDGICKDCVEDANCLTGQVCNRGICEASCNLYGCPGGGMCNTQTGRCEDICIPACSGDTYCNDGNCVPNVCNPACEAPLSCINGYCWRVDCRNNSPQCPGHPDWICNSQTGICDEPTCPDCEEGLCCSEATRYQCTDWCYTCSASEPEGTCPEGQYCESGTCTDIECSTATQACGAAATDIPDKPCCEGLVCCEAFAGSGGVCCNACDWTGGCAY